MTIVTALPEPIPNPNLVLTLKSKVIQTFDTIKFTHSLS